ncbi:C2 calcium-dependent domain-containing protein 4C [Centropristis striata]|uniref:C2 calcium-dependent domain-containing protein 4C n=1 Tax=Centropristis striata TaxID=184440 RepID=UPI0027DED1A8|nr:C2 calcium-dependent domain-containing protein 4C [Centropristis striata]
MWVFGKIRESMESIPLELSRYMGKSDEDIFLSHNLHNNILTPDMIPEFCLPPKLCKRSPLLDDKRAAPQLHRQKQVTRSSTSSNTTHVKMQHGDLSVASKAKKKPLPFSAEGYGLAGIYESPNTRRKESLFHSNGPVYMFDRSLPTAAPRLAKETNLPKKTSSQFLPLFSSKSLSDTGSKGSETLSSSDSSPLNSSYNSKYSHYFPSGSSQLKGAASCPSLTDSKEVRRRWKKGLLILKTSPSSPPSLGGSSPTPARPFFHTSDALQCPERLQHEHILPLHGRGKVRLIVEHTSTNTLSPLSTVRVHVVSLEVPCNDTSQRTLNCAVNLCLSPGKLQQQESSTIRNCRNPVFKEDFYFTELRRKDLLELQLRLKVVDKPAAGTRKKVTVIGVIIKPLCQLLPLKNE